MTIKLKTQLFNNVDADSIVALASELIRFENTNSDQTNQCIEFCAIWLRQNGVKVQLYEHQGMRSAVASVGSRGPIIILNGHLDVVPGIQDDFIPSVFDGKLFGRGSYDMLGAVASMMVLVAELSKSPPDCQVILTLVPDEESGGLNGTGYLVEQGIVGDIAICGEPTNLNIAIQAKGILQLIVEVPGIAAHGSRPWLGENAILAAMESFQTIASLNIFHESTPFFKQPSLNLAKINAGNVFNQVPDACMLCIDIRYLPGQDPNVLLERIREAVPASKVHVHFQGSPVNTQADNYYVQELYRHANTELFGQDGSADTRFYAEKGMPAVEFGPVGANHHGPGEYVEIESLRRYTNILKNFILHVKDDKNEI